MSRRRTQKSLSQRKTSTPMEVDDDDDVAQSSQNASLTDQEHMHHVSNVVKYILAADQSKVPIVRTKISEAVNCRNKAFRPVMDSAAKTLLDVFGYKVVDSDGKIILVNNLVNKHLKFSNDIQNRYGLLFLVLAHIYMSGESCTEDSLNRFLTKIGLIVDGNTNHEVFGKVHDLVYTEFVKEKYIYIEKQDNAEKQLTEIKWGDRAKHEVTPRSILEFMSKVYNGKEIQTWHQQYEAMLKFEQSNEKKKSNASMVVD